MIVRPLAASARMVSQKACRLPTSMPVVGSSSTMRSGSGTSASANLRRCCSPPEHAWTRRRAIGPRPARSTTSVTRSRRPCSTAIACTVSSTVKSPSRPPVCITALTRPAATARPGASPYTSTVPALGVVSPRSRSTVVVLPAPLGPRKATISPGSTTRSTASTAVTDVPSGRRKDLVSPVARMAGVGAGVLMRPASPSTAAGSRSGCHDLGMTPVTSRGRARVRRRGRPGSLRCGPDGRSGRCRPAQNAASSRSISERSVPSAMARSAVSRGRLVWAKNCAAATLPS